MLHLHIGRGKSGSSSLQALTVTAADTMAASGVYRLPSGNALGNNIDLASGLDAATPADPAPLEALSAALDKHPAVFASSEFLFGATAPERLMSVLAGRPAQIIVYLRNYGDWAVSMYSQRVRKGRWLEDFDGYLEALRPELSALGELRRWADVFGWQAMRIRTLQPDDLVGGRLDQDLWSALGITGQPPGQPPVNVSPHWSALEILRAVQAALPPAASLSPIAARRLCTALGEVSRPAAYLSATQSEALHQTFCDDLAELRLLTGHAFATPARPARRSGPAPSLAMIPEQTRRRLWKRLGATALPSAVKTAAYQVLKSVQTD